MIARLWSWFRARHWSLKFLLGSAVAGLSLVLLYVSARTLQYAAASQTPASLFIPEGTDVVIRASNLAGRWAALQETEFWKTFARRLQKEPGVRHSLNEILASVGAPTLDQLEDRRWLDRNPMLKESAILRFAGRDLAIASTGEKFCVATRIGLVDFLLVPGLQLFPGAAGAKPVDAGGAPALKRGDLFISIQGAVIVVSNDPALLASALRRQGKEERPPGLLHASLKAEPVIPILRGFPLGGLLAFADVETCERIGIDVEVDGADLVVRAKVEGLKPRHSESALVDTVRMIPSNGIGAVVTNVEAGPYWEWIRRVGDRRQRGGSELDRFARESFRDFVEILQSHGFGEEVISRLDGPVSLLFGASEGDDGKTYAATAFYMRSSQPREAGEALQGVIDGATKEIKGGLKATDEEEGGVTVRSYRYERDVFGLNNYQAICYAILGDALVLANNRGFLVDALRCRANQGSPMAVQLPYEQAMRRLQQLKMPRVLAPGGAMSLFLYGPHLRQGLEGFYSTFASKLVESDEFRRRLREEVRQRAEAEGQPLTASELDAQVELVRVERIREMEDKLRGRARILDYLKWVALQAEPVPGGVKLDLALELR